MNQTTNDKKIVGCVVKRDYPHLLPHESDISDIVRDTFSEIGNEVQQGNKILVKNFGTFEKKVRKSRPRYDTGLKTKVTTEPKEMVEFTQSPNIFRNGTNNQ